MKDLVSVVSTNGPSVTTIDGTGQKCAATNWCGVQTNDCSVVLINSAVGPTTRLDGFKITGGKGVHITSGGGRTVGGGIYCAGTPLITNNIITGNVLSGLDNRFLGGGVYVVGLVLPAVATITNNLITGNTAKPPTAPNLSYGLGGGIYSAYFANPVIKGNTITNRLCIGRPAG